MSPFTPQDKVDLLLVLDDSRSMLDKQQILYTAIPDLVQGLVNPRCVDPSGVPAASQPAGPLDACPPGTAREFSPAKDMHVGVISTSLGGHGADACPNVNTDGCYEGGSHAKNDMGHLLSRKDVCLGGVLPTYQGKGFLAWDPEQKLAPPGIASAGDMSGAPGLIPQLRDLVLGVSLFGCGYESQLESMYRFLVDPEPYEKIVIDDKGRANPLGIDEPLLEQRRDFLRPDSVLAILMLTDEDDCSIKEFGQHYFAAQLRDPQNPAKAFSLPRARSECAVDPSDPCCASCGTGTPAGCPPTDQDAECLKGNYTPVEDNVNLRCWDQKRRFGIDFLYPIDRYVKGLTSPTVPNRNGQLVQNPIFSKLDPNSEATRVRDPGEVFFAGIVGVPWQDVARDPADLGKGFKNAEELAAIDPSGHSTWEYILGDPENHVLPLDPHMIATPEVRSGVNPITGTALAPPGSPVGADPISGHEYDAMAGIGDVAEKGDLQYACIFQMPHPRDCASPGVFSCDCSDPSNDSPLCEDDPTTGLRTIQRYARAYPGLRELALLKGLGEQGVVASTCAAQMDDPSAADFGYRPAARALVERVGTKMLAPCIPGKLQVNPDGHAAHTLLEARDSGGNCTCDPATGRIPASLPALVEAPPADTDCICEIQQLSGAALAACQSTPGPVSDDGWCYVDADASPPIGDPAVAEQCVGLKKRRIRFTGDATPPKGAHVALLPK